MHILSKSMLLAGVTISLLVAAVATIKADVNTNPYRAPHGTDPHGTWVSAYKSSCEHACKAIQRDAFRTGHYEAAKNADSHYTVCRAPLRADARYAGRPGFQHHWGDSAAKCKIYDVGAVDDFDCLCN